MNRTNRSGIIKDGVIGGMDQSGSWKMDARFKREELIRRIESIAVRKSHIKLYNKDINSFITRYIPLYEENAGISLWRYIITPIWSFNMTLICHQFCPDLALIYHTPHEVMRLSAISTQKR